MRTITLSVSDKAYEKLKVIFSLFGDKDLKIEHDLKMDVGRKQIRAVLDRIEKGEEKFYTLEEVEASTDEILRKYGA